MSRTALLLLATGDGWWQAPARQTMARAAFETWWQGAATAALLGATASAKELPAAAERSFRVPGRPRLTPALWFWLLASKANRIVVAGPGAAALAARLQRSGHAVEVLGPRPRPATAPPPAGLPLRIA